MKKVAFSFFLVLALVFSVYGQDSSIKVNPDAASTPDTPKDTTKVNPDASTPDTPKDVPPKDTPKDTSKDTPKPTPGSVDPKPRVNTDDLQKQAKERDLARYGLDRRFLIPDGFRLSMDFKAMYSRQYDLEGGVNIDSEDVEHESFSSEGLFRFEFGNGRFGVAAFIFGRNISEKMEQGWATYLGHDMPELENWVQTHYSIIAGEASFRPFSELRLHIFGQLGWRNLGFEHSPKIPVHAIGGFRFSTGRYFNISAWAGTEIGLEMGSAFWHGKDAEAGVYLKANWLWNEQWTFDDVDFLRNVIEAEVGFKANLMGWLGFTLGGRHTWSYGWYPDEKNSFGQRQPALRLDSFQLFLGVQLTF